MKTLVGGSIGSVLGVVTFALWWRQLFNLLAGLIPIMLILGGGLAIYLGYDEFKESMRKETKKED